jgi:ferredoxin--NADP+ reductase
MSAPKHLKGRVTSKYDVTPGLWIIKIRPEKKIDFIAGQYVTMGLEANGKIVERPYSLASSPAEPELEFFVELVPDGQLTPQIQEVLVGDEVYLRPSPKGRLLFDDKSGHRNHLMIATVTGVAPFVSMVREFAASANAGDELRYRIVLLQAASVSGELGYDRELAAKAEVHDWLHYIPMISRIWLDDGWPGERGRAEDVARKYQESFGFTPADTTAYVCGNPNLIENIKGVLARAGFPKQSIKEEAFWVAAKTA